MGYLLVLNFQITVIYFLTIKFFRERATSENTIVQNLSWCNKKLFCTTTGIIEMNFELGTKRIF